MNITVKIIPHEQQRYETTGDWVWTDAGDLVVYISSVDNWKSETLVAIHEIIEAVLCKDRGIKEEDVSAFDIAHPELEDPGLDESAPYHAEHMVATDIEHDLCLELGEVWDEHNERLEALYPN